MSDYNLSFGSSFHNSKEKKQSIKVVQKKPSQNQSKVESTQKIQLNQLVGYNEIQNQ